jgi:hypothetical protein
MRRRDKKGQAVASEYMMVIFIVIGMVSAMTVYFRRAVQGKIYAARNMTVNYVLAATNREFAGNLYVEYEPYYANAESETERASEIVQKLKTDGGAGKSRTKMTISSESWTNSETAPPKEAD